MCSGMIRWSLPQLKGANYLSMDRQDYLPARANIYDRNGNALVAQTDATAVGLYPDQLDPAQFEQLYSVLAELTGWSKEAIQARVARRPEPAPAGTCRWAKSRQTW